MPERIRFAVRHASSGDPRAFEQLMVLYLPSVRRIVGLRVHDAAMREDLCQETFLRAWRYLGRLKNPDAFGAWLDRLASNVCLDWLRQQEKSGQVPLPPDDLEGALSVRRSAGSAEDEALARVAREEALALLPPAQRSVYQLLLSGHSPAEIGRRLGLSRSAVDSRLHRLRQTLGGADRVGLPRSRGRNQEMAGDRLTEANALLVRFLQSGKRDVDAAAKAEELLLQVAQDLSSAPGSARDAWQALGNVYEFSGRLCDAEEAYRKAADGVPLPNWSLGNVWLALGRQDEALRLWRMYLDDPDTDSQRYQATLVSISRALIDRHDPAGAAPYIQQAILSATTMARKWDEWLADAYGWQVIVLVRQGKVEEARQALAAARTHAGWESLTSSWLRGQLRDSPLAQDLD